MRADVKTESPAEITALTAGFDEALDADHNGAEAGMVAIASVFALTNPLVSLMAASTPDSAQLQSLRHNLVHRLVCRLFSVRSHKVKRSQSVAGMRAAIQWLSLAHRVLLLQAVHRHARSTGRN